jgi:arylsulfatase A-like enzyme
MNIILILIDSLNKSCIRAYNPDTVCQTPAFDAFARKSLIFDNHFVGSLPCMPARRDLFAGRKEFLWRPWGPLEVFDPRLPRIVKSAGLNTGIVTDHYHYWEEMANGYVQGFSSAMLIRGHETDFWKLPEPEGEVPAWVDKIAEFRAAEHIWQYYCNVKDFQGEEDYFAARVFSGAADWLDANAGKGDFFLQVEAFDVHEPFDVPEPYASMYTDDDSKSKNDFNIWPPYQIYRDLDAFMAQTTPQELAFLKAQYMGKTTMADRWLGVLLAKLDELNLWQDTMVILTTDHGHDLGERGAFGKQFPHYDSHANIPLMIWHPAHQGNGRRIGELTQTVDLFATLIEAAGGTIPEANRHSKSLLPLIQADGRAAREAVLYGTFGQGICLSDGDWSLFKAPIEGKPLYTYSTMIAQPLIVDNPIDGRVGRVPDPPVDQGYFDPTIGLPLWKMPVRIDPRTSENFLYHRAEDPGQQNNLWRKDAARRERMLRLMRELLEDEGYPAEQLERLGLTDIGAAT